nr:hypothetical protein [Tanacetum cinerariifolium]
HGHPELQRLGASRLHGHLGPAREQEGAATRRDRGSSRRGGGEEQRGSGEQRQTHRTARRTCLPSPLHHAYTAQSPALRRIRHLRRLAHQHCPGGRGAGPAATPTCHRLAGLCRRVARPVPAAARERAQRPALLDAPRSPQSRITRPGIGRFQAHCRAHR